MRLKAAHRHVAAVVEQVVLEPRAHRRAGAMEASGGTILAHLAAALAMAAGLQAAVAGLAFVALARPVEVAKVAVALVARPQVQMAWPTRVVVVEQVRGG